MNKLLLLALSAACGTTWAQTPATNPMPDGSRDMYVGLGVQSAPRWDGTGSRKVSALPVLQVQWSNGLFISGMSAGMHLADNPTFEYGPLLAVQPGRDDAGTGQVFDGVGSAGTTLIGPVPDPIDKRNIRGTRLDGMDKIGARLQGGVFANYYLTPQWRLTSSVLYGAVGFAGAFGFIHWALAAVPPASAQTTLSIVPVMTFLFAVLVRLERFRWMSLAGAMGGHTVVSKLLLESPFLESNETTLQ